MGDHKNQSGVTIVELIVVLVVVALFMSSLFIIFGISQTEKQKLIKRNTASSIAYSNLSKFNEISQIPINSSVCNGQMDLTKQNIPGLVIGDDSETDIFTPADLSPLGPGASQQVLAFSPYGCSPDTLSKMPIKIVSKIIYGPKHYEVSHVKYIH